MAMIGFRHALFGLGLFAAAMWLMAIIGAANSFSPVPFWDMWGGTLGFYLAHLDGNAAIWWAQHNEHRIVLSRLLFWLDFRLFGGLGIFLIILNFVFVALAVLVFNRIATHFLGTENRRATTLFTLFVAGWLILWMQAENLTWAFQSQFFLAQLLPLLALYLLARSANQTRVMQHHFILACLCGIACAGTMANGILALPLMAAYSLLMRFSRAQIMTLIGLSVGVSLLYFYDYQSPGGHGSISEALLRQPFALAHYVLLYLGSPFFALSGEGQTGLQVAVGASVVMAAVSLPLFVKSLVRSDNNAFAVALIFYIVYLAGTALGTGGGRLIFGVEQAVTYRYTTPALMAWAALLLLCLPALLAVARRAKVLVFATCLVLSAFLLNYQSNALQPANHTVFERAVAALALELRVRDEAQINQIYVMDTGLLRVAEVASEKNIGIFGVEPWRDLYETQGQVITDRQLPACQGHLDVVDVIDDEPAYLRLDGWVFDAQGRQTPQRLTVVNAAWEVAGYVLTGRPRPDVQSAVSDRAGFSGFRGYIDSTARGEPALLIADNHACQMLVDIPD